MLACFGRVAHSSTLVLVIILVGRGWCQAPKQSGEELIQFLTYQSGRLGRPDPTVASDSSGRCALTQADQDNRAAYDALIRLGPVAVGPLESALDSLAEFAERSPFWLGRSWLMSAYAHIARRAAFPRLRRMLSTPTMVNPTIELDLDSAVAVSLRLTSYISDFGEIFNRKQSCHIFYEPRDALDKLIFAWERNDARLFRESLGPRSMEALNSMLAHKTWEGVRAELWPGAQRGDVALGYRFEIASSWSQPWDRPAWKEVDVDSIIHVPVSPEINTVFKNSEGNDCGKYQVKFLTTQDQFELYRVDNTDLTDLLRIIASCATTMDQGK